MNYQHAELAKGGWQRLTLAEQMGNIGSEVNRALCNRHRDLKRYENAITRALELFDLTISDSRWRNRLKEIARAREVFCDAAFADGKQFKSSLEDMNRYLYCFALASRINK